MSESFYLGKKIVTENKSQWLKRNESFKHPKFFNGSSWIITVQASSNPTKMLEGRAHSGAHQANEGDEAQGSPLPLSGF